MYMARTSAPKPGTSFRLTSALGVGPGSLVEGQEVTVREIVPADEPGAHDNKEDAVVIEWDEPALVIGDDGKPVAGTANRAMSVGVENFRELFEEA
jgi:hypothetical protein